MTKPPDLDLAAIHNAILLQAQAYGAMLAEQERRIDALVRMNAHLVQDLTQARYALDKLRHPSQSYDKEKPDDRQSRERQVAGDERDGQAPVEAGPHATRS